MLLINNVWFVLYLPINWKVENIPASFNALTLAAPIPGTDVKSSTTGARIKFANVSSLTLIQ